MSGGDAKMSAQPEGQGGMDNAQCTMKQDAMCGERNIHRQMLGHKRTQVSTRLLHLERLKTFCVDTKSLLECTH